MTSIKVEKSTVKCVRDTCGHINPAESCLQVGDIVAWGYTSVKNLGCPDCGGAVESYDAETL